jgi:hypothetical protein
MFYGQIPGVPPLALRFPRRKAPGPSRSVGMTEIEDDLGRRHKCLLHPVRDAAIFAIEDKCLLHPREGRISIGNPHIGTSGQEHCQNRRNCQRIQIERRVIGTVGDREIAGIAVMERPRALAANQRE